MHFFVESNVVMTTWSDYTTVGGQITMQALTHCSTKWGSSSCNLELRLHHYDIMVVATV